MAPGLTLDEIERAARDAGLDPAHLRAAAAELDAGRLGVPTAPGVVTLERWVDTPLTDAGLEEAIGALRARFGPNGMQAAGMPAAPDTARVGAAHEWTHTTMGGVRTVVAVSPRGDRTRVLLTQTEPMAVSDRATGLLYAGLAAFSAALLAAGVTAAADVGGAVSFAVAAVVFVAAMWGGGALATPAVRRHRAKRAGKAADALDHAVRCLDAASGAPAPAGPVRPPLADALRLDIDALPDEVPADAARPRDRTRS